MAVDLGRGPSKTSTSISKYDDEGEEQLYLLEVIVDKIDVFKEGILETFQEPPQPTMSGANIKEGGVEAVAPGPLRVLVKFFDFPTIEIQEKEFKKDQMNDTEKEEKGTDEPQEEPIDPFQEEERPIKTSLIKENDAVLKSKRQEEARWRAEGQSFKNPQNPTQYPGPVPPGHRDISGKSCLFPMVPKEMVEVIKKYPLEIHVHRDATEVEPAHLIGTTRLNLGQEFIDAVETACTLSMLPITAYILGENVVSNVFGDVTGVINLLIRMSCFGATIFTQFKYIQGQQGFKFSISEGVMSSKGNDVRRMEAQNKKKPKSDLNEIQKIERPPFLTQDADIIFTRPTTMVNDFKVPVPWRKLADKPVTPKTCGPKKLFKDIPKPRKEMSFGVGELFPSVNRTFPDQQAFYPEQPIITGNTFEDCTCRGQAIPATSRQVQFRQTTAADQVFSSQGQRSGVLEIPPGTIFPCQFGENWVAEVEPCDCPSPNSDKKKRKNKVNPYPRPSYSNSGTDKNLYGPQQSHLGSQPPMYGLSQSQTSRADYPSLEQATPLLQSAPPPNTFESQTDEYCTIGEACFLGEKPAYKNKPKQQVPNQTGELGAIDETYFAQQSNSKGRGNITYSNKSDVQYLSCPSSSSLQRTVVCGLEGLLDPHQRNLQNVLQPGLMDPICPPDSSRTQPSLCSCPKFPKPITHPPLGGVLNCECTNILTEMKPIDLPYVCQQPTDSQATSVPNTSTAVPSPPMPNKQPHPNPECPLANMLKQAEKDGVVDQPIPKKPHVTETSSKAGGMVKASADETDKAEAAKNVSVPISKTVPTLGEGKWTKPQGSEKVKKNRQDAAAAAAAHSNAMSYVTEPTSTARVDDLKTSKASSLTSNSTGSKKKPKRKHKKTEMNKEPLAPPLPLTSIYPGCAVGHKDCIPSIRWIPKKMGWLWNIKDADGFMKPGRGWRPGSIPTSVIKIMDNVKTSKNRNEKKTTKPFKKVEGYKHMTAGGDGPLFKPTDDTPTVHLHKKHGKFYLSLCPPSKEYNKKKRTTPASGGSKGETVEGESDDDSNRPAQFRIDLKNPEGLVLDPDLYETEETSSNSEDSYQMEIIAPSTLRNRQPQPVKVDFEMQVTEDHFVEPIHEMTKKRSASIKKGSGKKSAKAK